MTVVLIIILVVIVLAVVFVIATYNGLISSRNRVENAWSQIDVQLKRRLDLIPNLVETVKGYAAHERETLEAVVRPATRPSPPRAPSQEAQADNLLTGALRQLFALSEAYPDLKANQNFLSTAGGAHRHRGPGRLRAAVLQRRRADATTPRSRSSRRVLLAGPMKLSPREYFEAEEGAREVPTVQF